MRFLVEVSDREIERTRYLNQALNSNNSQTNTDIDTDDLKSILNGSKTKVNNVNAKRVAADDSEYSTYYSLENKDKMKWVEDKLKSFKNSNLDNNFNTYVNFVYDDLEKLSNVNDIKEYFNLEYGDYLKNLPFEIDGDETVNVIHALIDNGKLDRNRDSGGNWPAWLMNKTLFSEDDNKNAYKVKILTQMNTTEFRKNNPIKNPYRVFQNSGKKNDTNAKIKPLNQIVNNYKRLMNAIAAKKAEEEEKNNKKAEEDRQIAKDKEAKQLKARQRQEEIKEPFEVGNTYTNYQILSKALYQKLNKTDFTEEDALDYFISILPDGGIKKAAVAKLKAGDLDSVLDDILDKKHECKFVNSDLIKKLNSDAIEGIRTGTFKK